MMAGCTPTHEKRTAPETSSGINSLIAACNKNDRFKLLDDDSVLPTDLDNPIHPIFCSFDRNGPLKRMLQLASQFLTYDSLLIFFIPLVYGHELTTRDGHKSKTYLSDPLENICEAKKKEYIHGVREALHCLAHSIEFQFTKPEKRVYARTVLSKDVPAYTSNCCSAFQRKYSAKIEIADKLRNYYNDADGYAVASRCAQFRHDFLFAATLVHEIVHAVGVMRRGNLREPCIRAEYPDTEWGYGWEHFMFGNVFNPQDRTGPGTHLMMRKVWADQKIADKAGGKEYGDVPMAYIAQWFRKKTWDLIAEHGPTIIPPPITHFKIQSSNKFGAWVVSSDSPNLVSDLAALENEWRRRAEALNADILPKDRRFPSSRILWRLQTTEQLQKSNVAAPVRIPNSTSISEKPHVPTPEEMVAVCRTPPSTDSCVSRKRPADSQEGVERPTKIMKV